MSFGRKVKLWKKWGFICNIFQLMILWTSPYFHRIGSVLKEKQNIKSFETLHIPDEGISRALGPVSYKENVSSSSLTRKEYDSFFNEFTIDTMLTLFMSEYVQIIKLSLNAQDLYDRYSRVIDNYWNKSQQELVDVFSEHDDILDQNLDIYLDTTRKGNTENTRLSFEGVLSDTAKWFLFESNHTTFSEINDNVPSQLQKAVAALAVLKKRGADVKLYKDREKSRTVFDITITYF